MKRTARGRKRNLRQGSALRLLTFIVEKTPRFSEAALNVPVIVRKTSVRNAAVGLRSGLTVKKANGKNNLVNISMRCNNPVKAENILHSIVHFTMRRP